MSLINNMLNNLEKAKKCQDPARKEELFGIKNTFCKQRSLPNWQLICFVMLLLITFSITWHYRVKIITNVSQTAKIFHEKLLAKKIIKNRFATTTAATIKLQNITLEQKNGQTVLDFVLSATTPYYIEHGSEQQLFITLGNTSILGNIPVSLENTFIAALNTKQNNSNIVTTLNLLPGTKIDELQLVAIPQPHLHLAFSNPQLTANSSMTKIATPISQEQQTATRYQEIQQLLAQNEIDEAISRLHMFVGDFPNHLQAREMLASLLIKVERLQKATDVLTAGLDKHPEYSTFVRLKAYILTKQNNHVAAIDLLEQHASSATNDGEYVALLAALYQQEGHFVQAAELYNQLTKTQPQKTAWWLGLGLALESANKKNGAKEAYRRALVSSDVPGDLREFLMEKIKK